MRELRRLGLHLLLLVVAGIFAFVMSRPEQQAAPITPGSVELWGGSPDDVTRIVFQDDRKLVSLERRKDDEGAWLLGKVDPVAPAASATPDAGPPPPATPVDSSVFAAVEQGEVVVKSLAPLRAKRALGDVGPDRLSAFGFEKPQGVLRVTFGAKTRELVVGGATPGDTDRYARDPATGLIYVVDNAIVRDLQAGESRLAERKLHSWAPTEVKEAAVKAGDKERRLVRSGTEGRQFWADAASPDQNDETANNWLQKLDRLRPMTYVESLPEDASLVVRVEYRTASKGLGYLELHRRVVDEKDEYFVSTERTRLHSTVAASLGEQVAEDLGSVVR